MTQHIAFFVFNDFQLLDLSGPLAAFQLAAAASADAYRISVISERGGSIVSSAGIAVVATAAPTDCVDTFVVVGGRGVHAVVASPAALIAARSTLVTARRIASVCTGAFLLAAAGLLNGRRATTHWKFATRLQAEYPSIKVDVDAIFINDGHLWTSAGITAGIDLALALIEHDLGSTIAKTIARDMVVYYRRPGGQSQFSTLLDLDPGSPRIGRALRYARDHLSEALTMERLAEIAGLSSRQFSRAFLAETGKTPAKAVEHLRAETARSMVEDGTLHLEIIARTVGFHDPERMRKGFIRTFGQPPQALRRAARDTAGSTR